MIKSISDGIERTVLERQDEVKTWGVISDGIDRTVIDRASDYKTFGV